MQGITLEVNGNCGTSAAPNSEFIRSHRTHILQEEYGKRISFPVWDFEEFSSIVNDFGTGINRASFVGYNTVRQLTMGMSKAKPTKKEILQIIALIDKALSEGALGLSFGLAFSPGCFSSIDELKKIVQPFRNAGIPLSFHIRNEWSEVDQSIKETVSIAEHANLPLHIYHLKALGGGNKKICSLLQKLNEFKEKRGNVSWDTRLTNRVYHLLPMAGDHPDISGQLPVGCGITGVQQKGVASEVSDFLQGGGYDDIGLAGPAYDRRAELVVAPAE